MKNVYHSEIMELLLQKGREGMHVAQLSRMVYNLHTDLFDQELNYDELHQMLRSYLWRQSNIKRSPFMHVRYGFYALKPDVGLQLLFPFDDPYEEPAPPKPQERPEDDPRQMTLF